MSKHNLFVGKLPNLRSIESTSPENRRNTLGGERYTSQTGAKGSKRNLLNPEDDKSNRNERLKTESRQITSSYRSTKFSFSPNRKNRKAREVVR